MELKKYYKNFKLFTYQPISQSEIATLKNCISQQDDNDPISFIILTLLSKFYIKKLNIKSRTSEMLDFSCYPFVNKFILKDNFQINSIKLFSDFDDKYLLDLLDNFSDSHKNYFEVISKLKSESTKRFFHYFYSNNYIFSNFVENISSEKLETFECEVVISAPELYFLLKNKLYEKYDTNFNKTLETIIKNIESIFNYTLKIEFQKSNNTYEELGKDYLNKKFNEHIYNFTITFNPQEENKKEE